MYPSFLEFSRERYPSLLGKERKGRRERNEGRGKEDDRG
jgi:hypothetical protein